jgi:hypothetical protein
MPKPNNTELMAARFYEAMLLIVAMGSVMPEAMRLAIGWSREAAAQEVNRHDADVLLAIIDIIERKILDCAG